MTSRARCVTDKTATEAKARFEAAKRYLDEDLEEGYRIAGAEV